MVFTIDFDDDPNGYPQGATVDIEFLDGGQFLLEDRYGTFYGDYSMSGNKMTLDFDEYHTWHVTLNPDGTFTGSEHGYDNGGWYEWLEY